MRYSVISLCFAAVVAQAADNTGLNQQSVSELCSIKTVAVVGDEQAVKDTRKRVEKKTWMRRVSTLNEADAILEVHIMLTSFSVSLSGDRVTSASREGRVTMKLSLRESGRVLWEGQQALDTRNVIDGLLTSLQQKARCPKR